jgi:tetratricopeptide (TPR) repeat protein
LAAVLICTGASVASAQDAKVLGRDDAEFAQALVDNHYPDLAERFLAVMDKSGKSGEAKQAIGAIKLGIQQEDALKQEDLGKRKDALIAVLRAKEKFVEDNKGSQTAEDIRNTLPDLYALIGEVFNSAIKKETDDKKIEAMRTEGDGIFATAETTIQARIDALKATSPAPDSDDYAKLRAARYNQPHLRYFHALLFAPGSAKRKELCEKALTEYEEFDLDFYQQDDAPMIVYYAYVDAGLCLKELGKNKEAIGYFEKVIALRQSYGDPGKDGKYPIPAAARDIVDIVCYALLQKVNLLKDGKELAKVVESGKEYFATMPKPFDASQSMLLAKAVAEAQLETGDSKGARDIAAMMITEDPAGIGGAWGRDIKDRAGGGGSSYTDMLKNAESKLAERKYDAALAICRQVLADVAGTKDEADGGCEAWLWIGYAYQLRGWNEEAALAYQTGLDRYPKGKSAADLLSREIDCYAAANAAARRKYYKDLIDAATNRLITYGGERAEEVQMKKAATLESDGDFLGAVEIYKTIGKASKHYTKAQLKTGLDYSQQAQKLVAEKKPDEAKKYYPLAEAAFKETIAATTEKSTGAGHTLDTSILSALDEHQYLATLSLARLYMSDAVNKDAEGGEMVSKLEQSSKWTSDVAKGPEIQNLRGRLYLDQGKYDEAEKWVEDLYKRDKKKAAGPAYTVGRAFDEQGNEKRKAQPNSIEAEKLWQKAAKYYWWSIELQVDGTVTQEPDKMKGVGDRLYVFGLTFNGVPDSRVSFVDWPDKPKAPDYWTKAAKIYEAALTQSPDYRMTINLGRTYGFLGKWVESAGVYAKLFDQEQVLTKTKQKLDPVVTKAKPELTFAYLEWGVAEQMAAQIATDDKEKQDRLNRAINTIFMPLNFTLKPDTSANAYWANEYHLVRALMDKGLYKDAQSKVEDLKRSVNDKFDEGKLGYQKLFEDTIEELKTKLFK